MVQQSDRYTPFQFTPDGYMRLDGNAGWLSPEELTIEHERMREEFRAALPDHLRRALEDLDEISYAASSNHTDTVIDELCRHMPGMAPVIRLVTSHIHHQFLRDVGTCCEEDAPAPTPETRHWRSLLSAALAGMALDRDELSAPERTFVDHVLTLYVEHIGETLEVGA